MERLTVKQVIQTERECVARQQCDRNCAKCDLIMDAKDILSAYDHVLELLDAEEQGLLARIDERFALAMLAGARAIEQNPRKYFGATLVHDVFGDKPKKISYHDAAKMLREEAEAAIAKEGHDGRTES